MINVRLVHAERKSHKTKKKGGKAACFELFLALLSFELARKAMY